MRPSWWKRRNISCASSSSLHARDHLAVHARSSRSVLLLRGVRTMPSKMSRRLRSMSSARSSESTARTESPTCRARSPRSASRSRELLLRLLLELDVVLEHAGLAPIRRAPCEATASRSPVERPDLPPPRRRSPPFRARRRASLNLAPPRRRLRSGGLRSARCARCRPSACGRAGSRPARDISGELREP